MYPHHVEPIGVRLNADRLETAWLVRAVAVVGEGGEEVLVAVAGVVAVQSQVCPLHEYVRHERPCGSVQDISRQGLIVNRKCLKSFVKIFGFPAEETKSLRDCS